MHFLLKGSLFLSLIVKMHDCILDVFTLRIGFSKMTK